MERDKNLLGMTGKTLVRGREGRLGIKFTDVLKKEHVEIPQVSYKSSGISSSD